MMSFWHRVRNDERGTMIPMYMLFIMIIVGLLTVVLDTTQVYLQRRALQAAADGASLAAADGIDVSNMYDEGLDEDGVQLVYGQAQQAVKEYEEMVNEPATESHQRVTCEAGEVQANRVQVLCNSTAVLPIVNSVSQMAGLGSEVEVHTESWADANIAP